MRAFPAVILLAALLPAVAGAQGEIGIYFDSDGLSDTGTVTAPYQPIQVWLVVKPAETTAGITQWECEVQTRTEGPEPLVIWQILGSNYSVTSPPLFHVGMTVPHPGAAVVPVAQATVLMNDPAFELAFHVFPFPEPSLIDPVSGYPVQLPSCVLEGGLRVPLTPSSGSPLASVARINDDGVADASASWGTYPWRIAFGEVGFGSSSLADVRLSNYGDTDLIGTATLDMTDVTYRHGSGTYTTAPTEFRLGPQEIYHLTLQFQPQVSLISQGNLTVSVGDDQSVIPLQGGVNCYLASQDPVQFGSVPLGGEKVKGVTIYNRATQPVDATPYFPDPCGDFTFALGDSTLDPAALPGGASLTVWITFTPSVTGSQSCLIGFGDYCGEGILEGTGVDIPPECAVDRTYLNFGSCLVGAAKTIPVTITNTGGGLLTGTVELDDPAGAFSITAGGGPYALANNQSRTIEVSFSPPAYGRFTATVTTGLVCDTVQLVGDGVESNYTITPQEIDFGVQAIASTVTRDLVVTNNGQHTQSFSFYRDGSVTFQVDPYPVDVAPGTQATVPVSFTPAAYGSASGSVQVFSHNLGDILDPIPLQGFGVDVLPGETNRIGFYFGASFTAAFSEITVGPGTTVPGFLVLQDPTTGVGGWEMNLRLDGDAVPLGWTITGGASGDTGPVYFRLLLDAPLPPAADVVLMSGEILVPSMLQTTILLDVPPEPAVPGYASFVAAADTNRHLPLGQPGQPTELAWINRNSVGVDAPRPPTAQADGNQVVLDWTCGPRPANGYHVYRRLGEGEPVRLTEAPLTCAGGRASFVDHPEGPVGTVVSYTLTTIDNGIESGPSPAAEVTLESALPLRTRLLASYPNPFNPQTTVPFAVGASGPVRLSIYDAGGRLVKMLVNETFPAGVHERAWQGRDDRDRPVPSGVYYLKLETGGRVDMGKITLLK